MKESFKLEIVQELIILVKNIYYAQIRHNNSQIGKPYFLHFKNK